ncbi:hypothetical protein JOF28_000999 [Leucobacter exalbidus]|uniref:DUF2975 domain-containing protein n=1 Tax=Leucobacter exalbidus TaxID=662960 RepID=A0A940PS66_9MICO|nr:hypothetical protein [Leucobacter exalbidus]MBP1325767.1 hypothetical protein [Leucobacter exalbidus]
MTTQQPGAGGIERLPRESGPTKMRLDAFAVLAFGIMAAIGIITLAVQKFAATFTPHGVVWQLPIEPQTSTATGLQLYNAEGPVEAAQVTGSFTSVEVTVTNLNTVSAVCLGAGIVLAALAFLIVVGATARIAWLFQRGRFFTLATSHALRTLNWSLGIGLLCAYAGWNLGANGIEAALNVRALNSVSGEWWSWYVIMLFAVTSFGLIDIALRRAIRVQHDAEGLI